MLITVLKNSCSIVVIFMLTSLFLCFTMLCQCLVPLLSFMSSVFIIGFNIKRKKVQKLSR